MHQKLSTLTHPFTAKEPFCPLQTILPKKNNVRGMRARKSKKSLDIPQSQLEIIQLSLNFGLIILPFMSGKDFELTIICGQDQTREVIQTIEELGVSFDLVEERAFAPSTQDIAIKILVALTQLLPLIVMLVKKLSEKKAYVEFETRHRLAKKMLAHLRPLYWIKGKDTPEYSYYEFKTARCKHYWELDRGEITHGPLRCS